MSTHEPGTSSGELSVRRLSRRKVLGLGLGLVAAVPLTAACGAQQPATPAAPAAKTESKPAETKPAAAAKTEAKPAEAAKPAQQAAGVPKAKINGRLVVVQSRDFHPDHNTFIENQIKEFAERQGYPLDHSYIEAYAGAGNVVQKLTAAVQANDAPDLLVHTLRPSELKFLEIIQPIGNVEQEIQQQHGKMLPAPTKRTNLDGEIWAVPHFTRAAGNWVRTTPFQEAGIDGRSLNDLPAIREAALKASKPGQELWGWGRTANRSGDGESMVREVVMMSGGQLTEETGQLVVLNQDPYRENAIRGLEWLKETYTDPQFAPMLPPGVNAWTDTANNEAYLAGKIFYTSNAGTMYAKAVVDKNPVAEDTWMIGVPKGIGPNARSLQGAADTMNFFIMQGAKNREAAEQMIKHLFEPEIMRQMFRISTGYVYPAHEWGWDEPMIAQDPLALHVTPAWKQVAFDPAGYTAGEWPGPPTPWAASLESSNFWTDMFGEILGGKAVPDAVRDAHGRAVRVFKEFGAKGE
ncbi:MAG: ABC transporter substrate-binding protein [Chloroflexota bacterium]|nr:ABC transporter substrate-binding protein [Chloroflexota bacterium]